MAMINYGAEGTNLVINGITIESFGDTDPPVSVEDVEPSSQLKRGTGGTSLRLDNATRPKRLTVNVLPGSSEAAQLKALNKSGVDINFVLTVNGSSEREAGFQGVPDTRGTRGRAGKSSVSDEQFNFVFNDSEET